MVYRRFEQELIWNATTAKKEKWETKSLHGSKQGHMQRAQTGDGTRGKEKKAIKEKKRDKQQETKRLKEKQLQASLLIFVLQ